MPIRLNVGVSKKLGMPCYGSLGASCNLEIELDQGLLDRELDGFHDRVRKVYAACREAVYEELDRQQDLYSGAERPAAKHANGNGAAHLVMASPRQIEYVRKLAGQIDGLGVRQLETLAGRIHDKPLAALTNVEASVMIDVLKNVLAGKLDLADLLSDAEP